MLLNSFSRGMKDMESDISSIEKRFAYGFLQKLLKWMEIAQEFIAHLGRVGSGRRVDDNNQLNSAQLMSVLTFHL